MLRDHSRFGFSVRAGRDRWFNSTLNKVVSDVVAVVAFLTGEAVGIKIVQVHRFISAL
jgi:hypothetical protein